MRRSGRTAINGFVNPYNLFGPAIPTVPAVSVAPLAWYAAARVMPGYSGPLTRVVRASDSATLDVPQNANGKLDMVAANAHRGASSHRASIVYDQSGNGYNALQTTDANRPALRSENAMAGLQGWTHDSYIAATAGTKVSKHFDLPNEISINRSDVTVFVVMAPRANYQSSAMWEIGTAATNRIDLFTTTAVSGLRVAFGSGSSPTVIDTTKYTIMNPEIYVVRTNGTNTKVWNGDTITTTTKPSAGTLQNGRFGAAQSLTDFAMRGESFAMGIYPAGLSDGDVEAIRTALAAIFKPVVAPVDYVVFEGDSLTEGIADTFLKNAARYVYDNLSRPVFMANSGVYGVTAATTYARRVQLWDGLDRTVTGKKIAIIALGVNDISGGATGANTWTNSLQPYIAYVKSRGYQVIVATLTPTKATGFDAGMQTERLALNTLIRDNAVTEGYTLLDYTTNAIFDADTDADNTTYYTADKVHNTTAAFTIKGQMALPLIEALLAA